MAAGVAMQRAEKSRGQIVILGCFPARQRWRPTQYGLAFRREDLIVEHKFNGDKKVLYDKPCVRFETSGWGLAVEMPNRSISSVIRDEKGHFHLIPIVPPEMAWTEWEISPMHRAVVTRRRDEFFLVSATEGISKIVSEFPLSGPFYGHRKGFLYLENNLALYVNRRGEKIEIRSGVTGSLKAGFNRVFYRRGDYFYSASNRVEDGYMGRFSADEWYPHAQGVALRKGDHFCLLASWA